MNRRFSSNATGRIFLLGLLLLAFILPAHAQASSRIEIRDARTGAVLFSHEETNNTLQKTVEAAVRANANLQMADLRGADLSSINLEGGKLAAADLRGANLTNANLRRTFLIALNMDGAVLREADFSGATLSFSVLRNADLEYTKWSGATIQNTSFQNAKLYASNFIGATLADVNFKGVSFAGIIGLREPEPQPGMLDKVRNDPNVRENAPPAYFPNKTRPVQYPQAKPQTHGLDLSRGDDETAKAYFDWLCANEAGEFINRTVENVDSVFEMRRQYSFEKDARNHDRYFIEDPWGWAKYANDQILDTFVYEYVMPMGSVFGNQWGRWNKGNYVYFSPEKSYPVLERVASPLEKARYGDAPFVRYTRVWPENPEYDRDEKGKIRMFQKRVYMPAGYRSPEGALYSKDRKIFDESKRAKAILIPKVEAVNEVKSRYGFMWRGIERSPYDRQLGIGGGEVLVFDLKTNELLAYRRNFVLSHRFEDNEVNWFYSNPCMKFDNELLHKKVLKPVDPYKNLNIN